LSPDGTVLHALRQSFTLDLALAVVVFLSAIYIWALRILWTRSYSSPVVTIQPSGESKEIPRLIVNGFILAWLIASTVFGSSLYAYVYATGHANLYEAVDKFGSGAAYLVCLGVAGVGLYAWRGLAAWNHILMDIVGHFYRSHLPVPWPWRKDRPFDPNDFPTQQQIEARFRRVLDELLQTSRVTHVTVVAHSQGTVIAVDVLCGMWARRRLQGKSVTLITLGSPLHHLYQYYFAQRYPPLSVNGQFNSEGWEALNLTAPRWLNAYRTDDFIGTYIEGQGNWPENHRVGGSGHTGYWPQDDVQELLAPYLPGPGGTAPKDEVHAGPAPITVIDHANDLPTPPAR
jgi:hypothetical protein